MSESGENSKEVAEALQPGQQESSSLKQETQSVSATQDDSNSPNENTEQTNAVAEAVSTAAGANASPNDKQSEPETAKKNTEAAEGAKEEKSAENEAADANDAQSDNDEEQPVEERKDTETATDATADSEGEKQASSGPIVSSSKKNRPPYKYDPNKITLRFLFANKDGLTVTVECNPTDTVGEVKGALISVWPNDMPLCEGSEDLRLICMGKGFLMPDTRTLEDCQIPVFKTHPTPINVSVKPKHEKVHDARHKKGHDREGGSGNRASSNSAANAGEVGQGCACTVL